MHSIVVHDNLQAERLRVLREAAGLSQFAVADRSGICRTRLSLVENGHTRLRGDEFERVEAVLADAVRGRAAEMARLVAS
jgi:transcriptional regulator with XRE-family HTH domain